MKLHLKYIVTLVITALVCIFAYQTYWLVGLYQSQEKEVVAKIKGGNGVRSLHGDEEANHTIAQ